MVMKIPFRSEKIELNITSSSVYYLNDVKCDDEIKTILDALENPIESKPLEDFIQDGTIIIVNDDTRSTPTSRILEIIYPKISQRKIRFVVACGSHPAPKKEGLQFIFGEHLKDLQDKIHIHDAKNDQFVSLGNDRYGNPHKISKIVYEAPRIITITSVEPHYFAGFMGGRKSFLPGVASYSTIESNHSLILKPRATVLNLKDNPVHLGMLELTRKFGEERIFSIQVVKDKNSKIYRAYSGNIEKAFEMCIKPCKEVSCVRLDEPVDIAVTAAEYPTDINFYQAQKSIDNVKLVVKKGGAILLVSGCREGVGNREFIDVFERAGSPDKALKLVKENFKLGYQKTYKLAEILIEKEIWGYTGINPSVLRSCFMKPILDLKKTLKEEIKKGKKIAFFPQGNATIPFVA